MWQATKIIANTYAGYDIDPDGLDWLAYMKWLAENDAMPSKYVNNQNMDRGLMAAFIHQLETKQAGFPEVDPNELMIIIVD